MLCIVVDFMHMISVYNGYLPAFMSPVDKKHVEAVEFYTKAIDLNPGVASYYGNRSIAHLRTEAFGYALQDASKALELDKNYIKVRKPVNI